MPKKKSDNLKNATVVVMFSLFLSRILGLVREMVIARVFGETATTDALYAAFAIPDFMFDLLISGALSSGFQPVFTSFLAKDEEDEAWKSANTFITVGIIFVLIFNIICILFARYLVPLVAVGMKSTSEFDLTVKLTRIMMIGVTFTVLAGLTRGILNSYRKFSAPAFGPVLYNVGMILGASVLGARFGIYGMAIGVIIGAMLNLAIQIPSFASVGKRFRLALNFKNKGYKRMLKLMGPALIGLAIVRINLIVNQDVASVLDQGSITAIRYAQRINLVAIGIFGAGISTITFPMMSSQIARKQFREFKNTFSLGLRSVIFITIPATVGMIAINTQIVRLLLKSGHFTESDVKVTAFALFFYSLGLVGQSTVPIIIRAFYSMQDTKTPVKVGFIILIVNVVLNLGFVRFTKFGVGGIALSSSFTATLEMTLLYRKLRKRFKRLRTAELLRTGIKSLMAASVMGVAAFKISNFIQGRIGIASKLAQLVDVGITIIVAVLIYGVIAYLLKMSELHMILDMIKRKFNFKKKKRVRRAMEG